MAASKRAAGSRSSIRRDQAVVYARAEEPALDRLRRSSATQALAINCRNTQPIARQTALLSGSKRRSKARVGGPPVEFIPYREKTGWGGNLERVINDIRREGVNPGQVSVLLARNPDEQEAKVLERLSDSAAHRRHRPRARHHRPRPHDLVDRLGLQRP